MSYYKYTTISGTTADLTPKILQPRGHYKVESAVRYARSHGLVGCFTFVRMVCDLSGHGRDGHDGRWEVDADNNAKLLELWREGGRVKSA